MLGFERNLTHLDGRTITLKREGVTQPGFVQTIKGEGMPIYREGTFGDLFVEYTVVLPTELSPELRRSEWLNVSHCTLWRIIANLLTLLFCAI